MVRLTCLSRLTRSGMAFLDSHGKIEIFRCTNFSPVRSVMATDSLAEHSIHLCKIRMVALRFAKTLKDSCGWNKGDAVAA